MIILQFIPLFGVLLLGYWFLVKTGFFPEHLNHILFHLKLPSGELWQPTWGDLTILSGVGVLFFELFKSTRTSDTTVIDHILSTFVLVGYMVIFLIYDWGGNSVFLILTMMSFLDVIAGFTITISAARRDFALGGSGQ